MNEVISTAADNVQNANGDSVDGAYNAWDHIRADAVFLANSVYMTAAWGGLTAGASAHPGATPTITTALSGATCIWGIASLLQATIIIKKLKQIQAPSP